jgi:peptidoglycan-associated lipoprotein
MTKRQSALVLVLSALALGACGGNKDFPPPKAASVERPAPVKATTTSADTGKPNPNSSVNISDEIRRLCGIIDSSEKAPKFDFDSSELSPPEKDLLSQVAKCLTDGPLKGRSVQLVGRADPRGEQEYNMELGGRRAAQVKRYLGGLGVDSSRMSETSRGKLDATGTDEEGWRKDRRVDINLAK